MARGNDELGEIVGDNLRKRSEVLSDDSYEWDHPFQALPSPINEGRIENIKGEVIFSDPDLRGAALLRAAAKSGVSLDGAQVVGCDLSEEDLEGLDLRGVNLTKSTLRNSSLRNSILDARTALDDTVLQSADLEGVEGESVLFDGADLRGTSLRRANLVKATFANLAFDDTDCRDANFQGGVFYNCRVYDYENFTGANLEDTTLEESYAIDPDSFKETKGLPVVAPEPEAIKEHLFPSWLVERAKTVGEAVSSKSWEEMSEAQKQYFLQEQSNYMTPEEKNLYRAGKKPLT